MSQFTENQVHEHIWDSNWPSLIDPALMPPVVQGFDFELWKLIKQRTIDKIRRIHSLVSQGELIGSKVKLPTDTTKPMELDFLGRHYDGLFITELKMEKSAERDAFTELLGYSNYLAETFVLSGHRDITNVLVARLDTKIAQQAYLYELLVADRDVIVYRPSLPGGTLASLRLTLDVPSDEEFKRFTNTLLSHDAMACVVASFHNVDGLIDSADGPGRNPPDHTFQNLAHISDHAAQLMESERLHGFCFVRKRWKEVETYYENSLIVCALNPFDVGGAERIEIITKQLREGAASSFLEAPSSGFNSRLWRLAQRALREAVSADCTTEIETVPWSGMVKTSIEVVFTHNIAFRPVGILREAYVQFLQNSHAFGMPDGALDDDLSPLQIKDIHHWFRAWTFMEWCGYPRTTTSLMKITLKARRSCSPSISPKSCCGHCGGSTGVISPTSLWACRCALNIRPTIPAS